jgi:hypothetical protein
MSELGKILNQPPGPAILEEILVSRIFNSRGIVIIDYDKLQVEAYLAEARAAGCRWITVNVTEGQLLYFGNRSADALAAITNDHCEAFYADPAEREDRGSRSRMKS